MLPEGLAESIDFDVARNLELDPKLEAAAKEKLRGGRASYFDATPKAADALPKFEHVVGMGFRPDGSLVVVDRKQIVHVDRAGKRALRSFPIKEIYSACVFEEGSRVLTMGYRRVALFDVDAGTPIFELKAKVERSDHLNMTVSSDARYVNVAHDQVLDLKEQAVVKPPRGSVNARAIRPDQKVWVTRKRYEAPFEVMRAGSTGKVVLEESAGTRNYRFVGEQHVLGIEESLLRKWDLGTGKVIATMKVAAKGMFFSGTGKTTLVATAKNATALVDIETMKVLKKIPACTYAMAVNAAGDRVAMVDSDGSLNILAV